MSDGQPRRCCQLLPSELEPCTEQYRYLQLPTTRPTITNTHQRAPLRPQAMAPQQTMVSVACIGILRKLMPYHSTLLSRTGVLAV